VEVVPPLRDSSGSDLGSMPALVSLEKDGSSEIDFVCFKSANGSDSGFVDADGLLSVIAAATSGLKVEVGFGVGADSVSLLGSVIAVASLGFVAFTLSAGRRGRVLDETSRVGSDSGSKNIGY
jgi:hypothetical protein